MDSQADLNELCSFGNVHSCSLSIACHLSCVKRKPVFGESSGVRHKTGCTTIEDG